MAMRFGLVGTGHWARTVHGRGLVEHPQTELVGVWGRHRGRTNEVAAELGTRPYAEVEDLFADVDAVAFAVPPAVQASLALRAATAGRHLLLDKPLAIDPADADAVVAAVAAAKVASVVFFTSLFTPGIRNWLSEVREQRWDGAFGWWMGNIHRPGSPYDNSPWRDAYGGLWDTGPHALSLLIPLLGPVTSVTAVGGKRDTVALVTVHEGGALGSVTLTLSAPEGAGRTGLDLWGVAGRQTMPGRPEAGAAMQLAITELVEAAGGHEREHPADVCFGAHVTHLLATAAEQLET
jgi:predicted dehydrogenase